MRFRARLGRLFGLHAQVALVALVLLVIPWVGYSYVKTMERFLRENQETQIIATARGVATALQDRPRLLQLSGPSAKITGIKPEAEAPPVAAPVQVPALEENPPDTETGQQPPKPLTPPASPAEIGRAHV